MLQGLDQDEDREAAAWADFEAQLWGSGASSADREMDRRDALSSSRSGDPLHDLLGYSLC